MKAATFACAIAALIACLPALAAPSAPRLGVTQLAELAVPDEPYHTTANADAAVAAALGRAKALHKRVLIDLGGNWCADCRILAGIMQRPEMQRFLDSHYVVVLVDVGRFDKNLQVPARFGVTDRLEGVPAVLVVDNSGKLVNAGHIFALDDARSMAPQAIADWLAQWAG